MGVLSFAGILVSGQPGVSSGPRDSRVRSALQDAVETDPPLLRRNPASKAFAFSRQKHRVEMKTWSAEEAQRFLEFTAQDADATLYRVALMTGARRGELLGLRRQDLDLDRAQLSIRQQWCRNGARGLAFKTLKTDAAGWRTVDLDPVTVDQLRAHLAAQVVVPIAASAALVFSNPDGTPYDPDYVTRRFERRVAAAGLPRLRFHDLRHTCASLLLEAGESVKLVAERLGDRPDTVLQTYSHVTPKTRSQAASRLAASIGETRAIRSLGEINRDR